MKRILFLLAAWALCSFSVSLAASLPDGSDRSREEESADSASFSGPFSQPFSRPVSESSDLPGRATSPQSGSRDPGQRLLSTPEEPPKQQTLREQELPYLQEEEEKGRGDSEWNAGERKEGEGRKGKERGGKEQGWKEQGRKEQGGREQWHKEYRAKGEREQDEAETAELSPLERAMGKEPVTADKARPQREDAGTLTQFGYSFFSPTAQGFAPQTEIPVGPDYLVGTGDQIILTVWGSIDGTFKLEVNRSGELVLPKVGPVKVAGERFGELPALLKLSLSRVYKDFNLNVNMGKLRHIKVYLVGEVARPGDYNLNSLSTLISALSAAGGPTKNGSLRNIRINRSGKVVETVDLYDFFLKGDKGKDIRLQPGDTILVPVIGPVAGIGGNVRRPAIYELKGERTLKDLLRLSGGINPSGYLQRVQLYRVQAHEKKVVSDINLDAMGNGPEDAAAKITLQDMDLVKVLPIDNVLHGYVRLEGYVLRPGDYALKPGMRLSALLTPDNLLPEYYRGAGQIIRLCPPDLHPEVLFFDVSAAVAGDPAGDLELREFDRVRIYARKEMEEIPFVTVNGEVQREGRSRYYENMTVRDLLLQAGGVRLTAYLKKAEITRLKRDGESVSSFPLQIDLADALRGGRDNVKLMPFDELSVRRIPNWAEERSRYVTLKGEFVFPGTYPVYKGERLSAVIARAGGFTDKAFLRGAKFTRVQLRKLQQKRMDEILARTELNLASKESELASASLSQESLEATKASLEGLRRTAEILKKSKAEGRLVIRLSPPEKLAGGPYDLELEGGDVIEVPSDPKTVSVFGQVYNPASFVYVPGEDVESYLYRSGGMTRDAEKRDIYLIKADGSVESRDAGGGFLGLGGFLYQKVESGDTLVVPQKVEKVAWLREVKDIATILGQLALAAGVIVAAGL